MYLVYTTNVCLHRRAAGAAQDTLLLLVPIYQKFELRTFKTFIWQKASHRASPSSWNFEKGQPSIGQLTLFKIVKTWKSLVTNCQHWRSVTSCYKSPPWWLNNPLQHLTFVFDSSSTPEKLLTALVWHVHYGLNCFTNNKFRQGRYSNIYQLYIVGALTVLRKKVQHINFLSLHFTVLGCRMNKWANLYIALQYQQAKSGI